MASSGGEALSLAARVEEEGGGEGILKRRVFSVETAPPVLGGARVAARVELLRLLLLGEPSVMSRR